MAQAASVSLERSPAPFRDLRGRRLTDRILEAFTHAYGSGAKEVAKELLNALERAEEAGREGRPERRGGNAMLQADRWVAFVDARDAYNRICDEKPCDTGSAEKALDQMKAAYRHWSEAVPAG